jgi:hypothetical protein
MIHRLLLAVALVAGCGGGGRARNLDSLFGVGDAIAARRPAAPSAVKRTRLPRMGPHP